MTDRKKIFDLVKKYYKKNNISPKFIKGKSAIPVSGKVLDASDIVHIVDSALDGWLTTGRFNKKFEKEIALNIGAKIAITTTSGSSANLIAFSTLMSPLLGERQLQKGDKVITVAASFPTTINPIIQNGCIPKFLDIELPTYNINPDKIEENICEKTKAIMIAHTLGNPYDLEKIRQICDKHKLWLVQDCCDAFGAKFNNKHLGSFGDIGTLSFYPAHHITTGEGGAVFTNNIRLKRIAESIRDWGRDCYCEPGKDNTCGKRYCWKLGDLPYGYDHKYTYSHLGYNLKITDMQAACGYSQIKKLKKFVKKRIENFEYLNNKFKKLNNIFILPKKTSNSQPSWFGYLLTIKPEIKIDRNEILNYLNQNNIGTRLLFSGNVIKQPYMKNVNYEVCETLTNSDLVMNNSFWIGVYPGLNKSMLDYIYYTVETFLKKKHFINANK
jgi:CDP-6-deoxy-D-xylo-4-hexulose-3-dehydrase